MKKHIHFPRIHSLQTSLFLSFTLTICALLAIILYYIFGIVAHTRTWEKNNFYELTSLAQQRLEKELTDSQDAALSTAYSFSCQKYLLSDDPATIIESRRPASDILNYASLYGDSFKDIFLLTPEGRNLSNTHSYEEIVKLALSLSDLPTDMRFKKAFYSEPILDQNNRYLVYLFPAFGTIDGYRYKYNPITGAVIYDINELLELVRLSSYPQSMVILLKSGQILGNTGTLSKQETSALPHIQTGQSTMTIDNQRYLLCRNALSDSDLELLFLMPYQTARISPMQTTNLPILLITVFLLFIIVLMFWILSELRRDIGKMTEDIRLAEHSRGSVHLPQITELEPISIVLNKTFTSLQIAYEKEQKLTADRYEALLAQTQAEMIAYRSQINPHFLFNTLESARSLAHHYGAEPVETLIGGMSQMFRYSLRAPAIVPLSEELKNLDSYLSIMNIRFPGRYKILRHLAPETLSSSVLAMTLQPLVENSIKHAFTGRSSGVILIQTFLQDDRLTIRVADNGIGMSSEALEQLLFTLQSPSPENNGTAIGIANISKRLHLSFGEQASLHVRSKEEYYTVVEIYLPYKGQTR